METKRQTVYPIKCLSCIGISVRLILSLTLYVMILLLVVTAFLYVPILVIIGPVLAALAVDATRRIHRRGENIKGLL